MSEIPRWKLDIDFMTEVVGRQALGPQAPCAQPLNLPVQDEIVQRAYDMAFNCGALHGISTADQERIAEAHISKSYPCLGSNPLRLISVRASRDVRDIERLS